MYYNKELFLNSQIKAAFKRAEKTFIALLLSVVVSVAVASLTTIIVLYIRNPDTFMIGYAMAIFATVIQVLALSIVFPFQRKFNELRKAQAEDAKGAIGEKYAALYRLGYDEIKRQTVFACVELAVSLVAAWVIAAIFPSELYNILAFIIPYIVLGNITLFVERKPRQKIIALENEIANEISASTETPSDGENS